MFKINLWRAQLGEQPLQINTDNLVVENPIGASDQQRIARDEARVITDPPQQPEPLSDLHWRLRRCCECGHF
jgi:hypothetical protein